MSKTSQSILSLFKGAVCSAKTAREIRSKLPRVNKVTIYRNLENLVRSGKLRRISLSEQEFSYEPAKARHHHAICVRCERIEMIDACKEENFSRYLKKKGFVPTYHTLEFFGVCKQCLTK